VFLEVMLYDVVSKMEKWKSIFKINPAGGQLHP